MASNLLLVKDSPEFMILLPLFPELRVEPKPQGVLGIGSATELCPHPQEPFNFIVKEGKQGRPPLPLYFWT